MDNTASGNGTNRRGGVAIAAVIGLIAAAALAGMFRPQLAQAWGSVSGSTQAQEAEVRLAVERYAQALDMANGEADKVKARLNDGIVTERYWSSDVGRYISEDATDSDGGLHFASNRWLMDWDPEEDQPGGTAAGVAKIGNDWRLFDLEQDPENLSTEFLEGDYKLRVTLVEVDGRWKVAWADEIEEKDDE